MAKYQGVPEELESKIDACVSKLVKNGKGKETAVLFCKTSILSQKKKEPEKPYEIVASKETETRCVYFSSTPVEKNINSSKEGKLLKNVEIFKSGTYRGIQFKNSGLDKMVANFHVLKDMGILPNVPVRADHPSFFGVGDIIDKVGGYVADLRREGSKLVADVRVTSQKMWDKIQEGTYINRSAEIGTYDDNEGNIYSPILYGFAWVDIPQVEGLSPKFSYSKDNKNFELINLNAIMNMEIKKEEENFPPKEEVVVETKEEETKEEIKADEVVEEKVEEKVELTKEFSKSFPNESAELIKLRQERVSLIYAQRTFFIEEMERTGKITPAQKEAELDFVKELTDSQFNKYKVAKEVAPVVVKLDKEVVETTETNEKQEEVVEKTPEEKADEFIKETN
jgi:hypothetical protein